MKKRLIALLTCLTLAAIIICFKFNTDAGSSVLNLTTQSKSIAGGKSITLKVNGIKSSKIKWKSSKPSVATVSKKGVVKGLKKGKATITGKYRGVKFTVKITVTSNSGANSDKPKIDSSGLYLGTCKNVDFYYMKSSEKYMYVKVINKNSINLQIDFEYINIDDETFNHPGIVETVPANSFRTIELYCNKTVPNPQKEISAYIELWKENYDTYGKANLSATIK